MEVILAKPTIKNLAMTTASTEYSYELPVGTRMFRVKLRNVGYPLKMAIDEGESGTTYVTIANGQTQEEIVKGGGATLYFQTTANSQVAEIISFN